MMMGGKGVKEWIGWVMHLFRLPVDNSSQKGVDQKAKQNCPLIHTRYHDAQKRNFPTHANAGLEREWRVDAANVGLDRSGSKTKARIVNRVTNGKKHCFVYFRAPLFSFSLSASLFVIVMFISQLKLKFVINLAICSWSIRRFTCQTLHFRSTFRRGHQLLNRFLMDSTLNFSKFC